MIKELQLQPANTSLLKNFMKSSSANQVFQFEVPKDMISHLMKHSDNSFSPVLVDPVTHRITEQIRLTPVSGALSNPALMANPELLIASVLVVSALEVFTRQMKEQLNLVQAKLDEILQFLYGDKKAELIAEHNYVNYVQANFQAIMENAYLRQACITNLQKTKKVASKDMEFYIMDLEGMVQNQKGSQIADKVQNIMQAKESLELALQLFVAATVLETYLSGQLDEAYLQFVREEAELYIHRVEKVILSNFAAVNMALKDHKLPPFVNGDALSQNRKRVSGIIQEINTQKSNRLSDTLQTSFAFAGKDLRFTLHDSGQASMAFLN